MQKNFSQRCFSWFKQVLIFIGMLILMELPQSGLLLANNNQNIFLAWGLFFGFYALFFIVAFKFLKLKKLYRPWQSGNGRFLLWMWITLMGCKIIFTSLNMLIYHQETSANDQAIVNLMQKNPTTAVMTVVMAVIFAPLTEELIFRGLFMNFFFRKSDFWAIFVSGLIFGLAHSSTTLASVILYCSMGWVLGYTYRKSQNLVVSTSLHFINNLPAVLLLLTGN